MPSYTTGEFLLHTDDAPTAFRDDGAAIPDTVLYAPRRTLRPVPEYREQAIERAVAKYDKDRGYWERAWAKEHHYFVDELGIIYKAGDGDDFLNPLTAHLAGYDLSSLLPGHHLIERAPLVCPCGNNQLAVYSSGSYEQSARCAACGFAAVVYEG